MENSTEIIENNTQVIEVAKSQTSSSETKFSILELLNHVRKIWLNPGERISRGEYLLAWIPFSIISALLWVIAYKALWLSIYGVISGVLGLISVVMWVRLIISRLHDLNKSARNVLWFLFFFILILAFFAWLSFVALWYNSSDSFEAITGWYMIPVIIWLLLLLVSSIFVIILGIKLLFFKWTTWDNQYWHDPLPRQSTDNTNYIIIFLAWVIISVVISAWWPQGSSMSMWWFPAMQWSSFDWSGIQDEFVDPKFIENTESWAITQ